MCVCHCAVCCVISITFSQLLNFFFPNRFYLSDDDEHKLSLYLLNHLKLHPAFVCAGWHWRMPATKYCNKYICARVCVCVSETMSACATIGKIAYVISMEMLIEHVVPFKAVIQKGEKLRTHIWPAKQSASLTFRTVITTSKSNNDKQLLMVSKLY